jgi:hypothetical protein
MAEFRLNKTQYPRSIYEKVIDTSFTQNTPPPPIEDTITVEQFFNFYSTLFYDIPVSGDINSHAYLVKTSGEYIGFGGNNEDIQVLLDEITSLQQENLVLNQQLLQLQTSGSQTTSI